MRAFVATEPDRTTRGNCAVFFNAHRIMRGSQIRDHASPPRNNPPLFDPLGVEQNNVR